MKKLFYIVILMGFFQSPSYALNYTLNPNPAMEGQILTFGLLYFCGESWSNPNVSVNGSNIYLEISYHNIGCPIGVPQPAGYEFIDIGSFTAGDYQLNLTVLDRDDQSVLVQETIPFGVLPVKPVPMASNFTYWVLISLTLLLGGLWFRRKQLT